MQWRLPSLSSVFPPSLSDSERQTQTRTVWFTAGLPSGCRVCRMPFTELLVLVRPPSFHDIISSLPVFFQCSYRPPPPASPSPLHQHHLFNFPLSLDQQIKPLFFLGRNQDANASCNLFSPSSDTAPSLVCFPSLPHCLFAEWISVVEHSLRYPCSFLYAILSQCRGWVSILWRKKIYRIALL